MIKYIGSKRRLVPVLGDLASAVGARSAVDLFTGTTRVAQELKSRGMLVTAVDSARYAEVFARCYVATDRADVDDRELEAALADLAAPRGTTATSPRRSACSPASSSRSTARRIDAIRDAIERTTRSSPLYPVLLTSLIEAADRVDSTTGVQMAYVKQWAPRSYRPLELRAPELLAGSGVAVRGDACDLAPLGSFDFAYLDPPYNQHRYFTNYHIWETLVAWDAPVHYGVACKRVDARDPETRECLQRAAPMGDALAGVIRDIDADVVAVSYNDESWVTIDELQAMVGERGGAVCTLAFDSRRYVGAQIGIHNPQGEKVGTVARLRNVEYVVVGGPASK